MTRRLTPLSARGRPSAAASPMPTSTCSSAAAFRRASSRARPCLPTARLTATPGSRRSSTARSITSTPPGICRTTRARRRCRIISATRGSPSRPSAWPCATRPRTPPSGRTAAPTPIITTSAMATRRRRPPSPRLRPPCAASGTTGAPCWNFAARHRRSTPACAPCSLTATGSGTSTVRSAATCPRPATSARTTSRSSA